MKKRILSILLCGIMAMSLVACGKASSDTGGQKKKINVAKTMEAFKDYYNEYSEKHYIVDLTGDIDSVTANHWDCVGKIVYIENQPMMIIADLIGKDSASMDLTYNVKVLSYENDTIIEKYSIKDLISSDDGFSYCVDNNILLLCAENYIDADNTTGVVYELKNGEVLAYQKVANTESNALTFCEYLGNNDSTVEVDREVNNIFNHGMMPYNYFISDSNEKIINNKYKGALTQEDFCSFLDEVGKLDDISSEAQIEIMYCDFMGYTHSGIYNENVVTSSISDISLKLEGKNYTFSYEEGIKGLSEMPTCVQTFEDITEASEHRAQFKGYYRTKGYSILDEQVDEGKEGAILGSALINGSDVSEGKIMSSYCFGARSSIYDNTLSSGNTIGSEIRYNQYSDGSECEYSVLKLTFTDDYELDGVTNQSDLETILSKGYRQGSVEDVYYNIYSEKSIDFNSIDSDYEQLFESGLTNDSIRNGGLDEYIPYGDEYIGVFSYINGQDTDAMRRSYAIDSQQAAQYSARCNPQYGYSDYSDTVKMTLSLASQLYLLNNGDIDYFVLAQIDTNDIEDEMSYGWYYPIYSPENGTHMYDDNVLSLYIITSKDNYVGWLEKAGWNTEQ